jgi:MarR family transcriptional regulator, lower aerobic nicotinate degradation pathway regulator
MTVVIPDHQPQRVAKELSSSIGFLLARLGIGFKQQVIANADEHGYELYDYGVLALLAEGARETQSTIAEALDVDPSRMTGLLDSLEGRGFVERQRDPQDRRRHVVRITPAGKRELTRLRGLVRRLEDAYLAPLDEAKRATLFGLLAELAAQNDPNCCPFEDLQPPAA